MTADSLSLSAFMALLLLLILGLLFTLNGGYEIQARQSYPHWIKLDAHGTAIAATDGPWRCVVDTNSGLVWENKRGDESVGHGKWTYSWSDNPAPINTFPEGSCSDLNHCSTAAYVQLANQQAWCGYSNWRVPTLDELQTLLDFSDADSAAKVCPCFLANTMASSYWSSNSDQSRKQFGINFKDGEVRAFPQHASLYLRLVADTKKIP